MVATSSQEVIEWEEVAGDNDQKYFAWLWKWEKYWYLIRSTLSAERNRHSRSVLSHNDPIVISIYIGGRIIDNIKFNKGSGVIILFAKGYKAIDNLKWAINTNTDDMQGFNGHKACARMDQPLNMNIVV